MTGISLDNHDARRSLARALMGIGTVVSFGTAGYMFIEGWPFWEALFFTIITITTVGYGDYGLSEMGERFTAILLLGGLSVATYSFSQIVHAAVRFRASAQLRTIRKVRRMADHYIICGLGRIGRQICQRLMDEGHNFVAIDLNTEAVEQLIASGGNALVGDATKDEILILAGIEDARCIACVTPSDSENIVIALSARHLSTDVQIISRVDHDGNILKCERAGADIVVSPTGSGAHHIVQCLLNPALAQILNSDRNDSGFSLVELHIEPGSAMDGTTVEQYGQSHADLVFVAHSSDAGEPQHRPHHDAELRAGDTLIVAGNIQTLTQCTKDAASPARKAA